MFRLLRLIFMGYWHDKPEPEQHLCRLEIIQELNKNSLRMGNNCTSKVYVNRCKDCGQISHYEVKA